MCQGRCLYRQYSMKDNARRSEDWTASLGVGCRRPSGVMMAMGVQGRTCGMADFETSCQWRGGSLHPCDGRGTVAVRVSCLSRGGRWCCPRRMLVVGVQWCRGHWGSLILECQWEGHHGLMVVVPGLGGRVIETRVLYCTFQGHIIDFMCRLKGVFHWFPPSFYSAQELGRVHQEFRPGAHPCLPR